MKGKLGTLKLSATHTDILTADCSFYCFTVSTHVIYCHHTQQYRIVVFLTNIGLKLNSSFLSAATELESTSVVFVHGLDLYCTSMTPSKGFDLLNDDFDYYVISSVLMALIAAAFVTKKMSQRKALNQAWR